MTGSFWPGYWTARGRRQNGTFPPPRIFSVPRSRPWQWICSEPPEFPTRAYVRLGGYDDAERALLLFLPDWLDAADAEGQSPIRCLRAQFRADEKLTHRDFLGSLMGMGIIREKLGDILVSPDSTDLIVLDTVADFLLQSWNTAGRAG